MATPEKVEVTTDMVWRMIESRYNYFENRIKAIEDKLKVLVAILTDKEIIGEEVGEELTETVNIEEILDIVEWYLDQKE